MKLLTLLFAAALVTGCSLSRPAVERQSYLLAPQRPPAVKAASNSETLKIGRIQVAAPFDGRSLVYRRDDQRFENDFYNEFGSDPAEMIGDALTEWLRRGGRFAAVTGPRSVGEAGARLDVDVTALYVDFRHAPTAVLSLRWRASRASGAVVEGAVDQAVPLAARTPAAAAQALQEALGRALTALEAAIVS